MPAKRFTLITEHDRGPGAEPAVRRTRFDHFYEAAEYARNNLAPEVDGSTMPNVSQHHIDNYEKRGSSYTQGVFSGPNRYGAIINHRPHDPLEYPED